MTFVLPYHTMAEKRLQGDIETASITVDGSVDQVAVFDKSATFRSADLLHCHVTIWLEAPTS